MLSYNTRTQFANAEQRNGYEAAQAGLTFDHVGLTFVGAGNVYRLALGSELQGILMARSDIALAERLASSSIDLDAISFDAIDAEPLPRYSWDAYADAVCTCYDLPDGRAHVCGNCLDKSAARWGVEVPY